METPNYRIITRKTDGTEIKNVANTTCHEAKSFGGSMFHQPDVASVVVADIEGKVFLYLVAGHPEKTQNVSSKMAKFG